MNDVILLHDQCIEIRSDKKWMNPFNLPQYWIRLHDIDDSIMQ